MLYAIDDGNLSTVQQPYSRVAAAGLLVKQLGKEFIFRRGLRPFDGLAGYIFTI